VGISGCVDDFGTNGISATTNDTGMAAFLKGAENSIQYCWYVTTMQVVLL
jgi:hypothetical protein